MQFSIQRGALSMCAYSYGIKTKIEQERESNVSAPDKAWNISTSVMA